MEDCCTLGPDERRLSQWFHIFARFTSSGTISIGSTLGDIRQVKYITHVHQLLKQTIACWF